ncbi:hypothetical protein [Nostoc piscinale]|uniref:hypothetical protein n=1 Tax=Nostoc piscinale TaxID=224012 RepID=UPI000A6F56F3|nr:hypothetical protein [Nostoc piscinale]
MTSCESDNSNTIEVDGIEFVTLMPELVVQIPPNLSGAKTQVQFGIQISNNTKNPRHFLLFVARPEFLQANKQKVSHFGPTVNTAASPELSDFKLLMPGERVNFLLIGHFEWFKNELGFAFIGKDATQWWYGNFQAGTYFINVIYGNEYSVWEQHGWSDGIISLVPKPKRPTHNYPREITKIENVWTGNVVTLPIEFCLIQ